MLFSLVAVEAVMVEEFAHYTAILGAAVGEAEPFPKIRLTLCLYGGTCRWGFLFRFFFDEW